MRSIGHFIGGKEVKGTSGRTADVFEPMTGDVQAKVALASKAEVRAAVENARDAQVEWANTNPQRRARVMMKFLELAQRDYDKLADVLAREVEGALDAKVVDHRVYVGVDEPDGVLPRVVNVAQQHAFTVTDLSVSETTLETVFIQLTGRDLRE